MEFDVGKYNIVDKRLIYFRVNVLRVFQTLRSSLNKINPAFSARPLAKHSNQAFSVNNLATPSKIIHNFQLL